MPDATVPSPRPLASIVFFHDADDYLGADALRRFVGVAQQHDSDVVAGRVSWIGRPEGEPGPTKTVFDADLLDDGVWRSLTPHKLIRRSLIEDHQLRFCDDMVQGEDQVFMASCLFAARKISILSDTDLYHRRMLTDGSNLSRQRQTLANKRLTTSRMVEVVVANTDPGRAPGSPAAAGLRTHSPTSFEPPVHGGQTGRAKGVPRGDASRGLPLSARIRCWASLGINNG